MPRAKPKRIRLSKRAIAALPTPPAGKRAAYYDDEIRGLCVQVSDRGSKTFYLYRRIQHRPERVRIGRFPDLAPTVARQIAQELIGDIARGGNPQADRRRARTEMTFAALFADYVERHAKPRKRTWREDERQYNKYVKPAWRARRVTTIRRTDVQALHAKIGRENGPYAANRVLALVRRVFNHALDLGVDMVNPARRIQRFREQSRERYLDANELRAFFKALSEEPEDTWHDFFALALLTGARRSNLLTMAWADIDLERGLWRIPADHSKSGAPMAVVLCEDAVKILQRRAERGPKRRYVFPSKKSRTGHMTDPSGPWKRICKRAKLADVRIHDLRRTLGSWQAAAGASLAIIGKSLGHTSLDATAVYARMDLAPVRASVNTATRAMLAVVKDDETTTTESDG